jgi:hydroxymethylbilane synthase
LMLFGVVASPDGRSLYRGEASGSVVDANELGRELAERLLSQGAQAIVAVS